MPRSIISRVSGLSMTSIIASSIELGGSILVISARGSRAAKHVDRFGGDSVVKAEKHTGLHVVFTGDMDKPLDNPVQYVGYLLGEAAEQAGMTFDGIDRVALMEKVTNKITALQTRNPDKLITQETIIRVIERSTIKNSRRSRRGNKSSTWLKAGKVWGDTLFMAIMNWANHDKTANNADEIVAILPSYTYDVNTLLNGKKTYSRTDIAMATPGNVLAVAVFKSGKLTIIGTFENAAMIKTVGESFAPFIVVKKGMKIVASFCNLLRQGMIDGNTILTAPNGRPYSFAAPANVQLLEDYKAFDFLVQLGLAVYWTEGNRTAFNALNRAYAAYVTERDNVENALAGIVTTTTTATPVTGRNAFAGIGSDEDQLVGAGVGSTGFDSAPNFGQPTSFQS